MRVPAFSLPALALCLNAQQPPAQPLSAADRKAVVAALAEKLKANYVFPDVADRVGKALGAKEAEGAYAALALPETFSKALTQDLRDLGQDGHFRVGYDPSFTPQTDPDAPPTADQMAQMRRRSGWNGYGIAKTEILPGHVGYLDLRGFGPTEVVGPAFASAMNLLSGTEALIVDLRQNGGGDPETVAFFVSFFFPEGDSRHLNDIYNRPDNSTRQYWTSPTAGPRYAGPVYVLTSARTFSGGEECAYDFQTQKRATLVGETTGGGANPGDFVTLGHGFVAFIPTGRAINPITHTNWEHSGVKPDLPAPASDALRVAHAAILKGILAKEKDADYRKRLEGILAQVEKGEAPVPDYKRH